MAYEYFTVDVIHENMLTNVSDGIDKREGSVTHDLTYPTAMEVGNLYIELDTVLAMGMPQTAEGEFLDNLCQPFNIVRKEATKSVGDVVLTGRVGLVAPVGTRLQTGDDTPIYFVTLEEAVFEGEPITVHAEAEAPGESGNVGVGAIVSLAPGDLYGVVTAHNPEEFDGGADIEDDDALRQRLFDKASRPATSGNAYHYEQWTMEVPGVGACKVYPIWNGAGTVKVVIADAQITAPTDELVAEVTKHLEEVRPIGADVTVEGAQEVEITITATLELIDTLTAEQVTTELETMVREHLQGIAFEAQPVRYNAIAGMLISIDGVRDFSNLKVNGGTANIEIDDTHVAVLGEVTLT